MGKFLRRQRGEKKYINCNFMNVFSCRLMRTQGRNEFQCELFSNDFLIIHLPLEHNFDPECAEKVIEVLKSIEWTNQPTELRLSFATLLNHHNLSEYVCTVGLLILIFNSVGFDCDKIVFAYVSPKQYL